MADIQNIQLTDKQVERLSTFLLERTDYSLLQLIGFFTAIQSSPRPIEYTEWLERLALTKSFENQKESEEIIGSLSKLYNTTQLELREKSYKPVSLKLIQESKLPASEVTDLFLDWVDGYLLGMDLIGHDWITPEHKDATALLAEVMKIAKHLYDDETRAVTAQDFDIVKTNIKAFHDYWAKRRVSSHNER